MTAPWWEGPLVGFDLETTSPDPETARIVTATVVLDRPGADPILRTWLVDPGIDIPEAATSVHGITTEHAREHGQDPATAAREVIDALVEGLDHHGAPVVAFNAAFDFTVLDREARRYGLGPTLTAMCEHYGVALTDAHDATADALAAVGLVRELGRRHPFPDPGVLHAAQVGWRAEQCASLAEYFARQGRPQEVRGEWPLLPVREEARV